MAPKPIWGTITSYFYPVETEEVVPAPDITEKDNVDEDGWMLVGPKRAPSPDTDEVGSVIMVNHGSETDDEELPKTENEVVPVSDNKHVVSHMKKLNLIEQMLFEHSAASSADRACNPKNSWRTRNNAYAKSKSGRVRQITRNPGRRCC